MKIKACLIIVVTIIVTHFLSIAYAQNLTGPVAGALGGTGVAANDEGEQIFLNPATVAHAKNLSVGYFYQGGYTGTQSRDEWWGVSVTDNSEDIYFAGSALYAVRRRTFEGGFAFDETRMEFSIASIVVKHLAIGGSLYRLERQPDGDKKYELWDFSLGALFNPDPNYAIGAVYKNLSKQSESIPALIELKDYFSIGGYTILMRQFRGRLDLGRQMQRNPDGKIDFSLGFESFIDAYLVFRFGYQDLALSDESYYSTGFGFIGPRLKIDYALRQNVDDSDGTMHSVDFRLPF